MAKKESHIINDGFVRPKDRYKEPAREGFVPPSDRPVADINGGQHHGERPVVVRRGTRLSDTGGH